MDINQAKTKSSTEGNSCGEFVSRNLNYGRDVSRISANICRAVVKNPLDLPQLCYHLNEREFNNNIPIRKILRSTKCNNLLETKYVKTFYILTMLYPNSGLNLLKKSLEKDYEELIYSDVLLSCIKTFGHRAFKVSFLYYSIVLLYASIQEKLNNMVDSMSWLDSSAQLLLLMEPGEIWREQDPIGLLTSKLILARSWNAVQDLYRSETLDSLEKIFNELQRTDQNITFKELGIISTTDVV
jgi:hypothetical protein